MKSGAGNEIRTRDPNLGKVVLYQLSYSRNVCGAMPHDGWLFYGFRFPRQYFFQVFVLSAFICTLAFYTPPSEAGADTQIKALRHEIPVPQPGTVIGKNVGLPGQGEIDEGTG